jgi:1-acyl-sn-glycerol-3-phosphate acyltransferase
MEYVFISLYRFFQKQRTIFWFCLIALSVILAVGASQITLEEDISKFFPDDARVEKLSYVFRNAKFSERVIGMVSIADSSIAPNPDSLIATAERYVNSLNSTASEYIVSIQSEVDDSQLLEVVQSIQTNLPVFLEEGDYREIDSLLKPEHTRARLLANYRQLISPSGIVTKNIIVNDPLGISFIVLKKLQNLQFDQNVEVYQNNLISKDHRHLLFFIEPKYKAGETGKNTGFLEKLDQVATSVSSKEIKASYFGAPIVAAGNAKQLQRDTALTISIMLVLLAIFILGHFRKKRVPFLIMFPVVFGALFSLCMITIVQGSISIIAIAAGSIILGIAINYSLHFLSHLKHVDTVEDVIKDLVKPMTLGSATTVLAFVCLQFVNASVLRDVGLFAAFSLVGAALCTLIFLPQFISQNYVSRQSHRVTWIEKISQFSFENNKPLLILILVLTPFLLYFANDVEFNTDLSQMNFMTDELKQSQARVESINKTSLSSTYLVSQSTSFQKALQHNEVVTEDVRGLQHEGGIQKFSSVSSFIISDSLQRIRIARWNNYWKDKSNPVIAIVRSEGKALNFSEKVFQNFERLVTTDYQIAGQSTFAPFRKLFFDNHIIEKDGLSTVITLTNILPERKQEVLNQLEAKGTHGFDRQMITNLFVEYVHEDFNFIVAFTGIIVFIALLLMYGRIELTLMTFVPMLITWIWILGIMALIGIEFNIVNVMISTFIFGLGDDYSIFTMDGLLTEYQFGKKNLTSIRTSILLSALTTISGLGVLIFAEHPALRSIAGISIIGIVSVFFMSQTLQPFLFRWMITNRTAKGLAPMTAWGIGKTIFTYGFFVGGSFFLTIVGLVLKLIPFGKGKVRLFYHTLISFYTRLLITLAPQLKIRMIGYTKNLFSRSTVLIANHTSFLDILLTTMLHPKLILLTNKWVWNSPIFGGVVRLADYYPVMEGAEDSIERVKDRVAEGYSIVVFPEGTRTSDGKVKRFHKGAFYMAEVLGLPIQPLIIHGADDSIPKSTIFLNTGPVTLKFLPAIEPNDSSFGSTYAERAKNIGRYFRREYEAVTEQEENPNYFQYRLFSNYIYKGPVLEWYMKVKVALEGNYKQFHELIPLSGQILDLGCGYGFLCYMLAFLSEERVVTGVDYDAEKVETAKHGYSRNERISFEVGDVTTFPLQTYDAIIIADVLHYLTPKNQELTIHRSITALKPGGTLIIRDGNAELKERHQGTQLTELFSVKILKFNKSANDLHFLKASDVSRIAAGQNCSVEIIDDTKFTSNVIFVIRKQNEST